jgi:hypothetical protein
MQLAYSSRVWNETPIRRRTTDGYVNATAMCKANGKRWSDYRESDRCQQYLDALSQITEIPVFDLMESQRGNGGGTYVHPQVAVDLARWISAPFAVWMDGWFIEEMQAKAEPASQPVSQLDPVEKTERTLKIVKEMVTLFDELGGIDERDQILFKDIARNQVLKLTEGGVTALPAAEDEMTLSDAWLEVTGQPLPRGQGPALGRVVAELYRENFDSEPPTRTQWADGAPRKVKSYRRGWLIGAIETLRTRFMPASKS